MKWKSEIKLTNTGFIITIIILVTFGFLFYHTFNKSLKKEERTKHTYLVLQISKEAMLSVNDAETSQRGYIITGNDSALIPYYNSVKKSASLLSELKFITQDNVRQQKRCIALEKLFLQKYSVLQKAIVLKKDKGSAEAIEYINQGAGKRLMDEIKSTFNELDYEEHVLLLQREKDSNNNDIFAGQLAVIGIVFGVLIFAFIYFILRIQINRRRQNEEELFIRKEWFTQTLANLCDGVISTDINGVITMMNKAACEISGWKEEEAIGKYIDVVFDIRDEDSGKKMMSPTTKALNTNNIVLLSNHTILKRKDGAILFVDDNSAPIHNKESEVIGAILIFRDITEKKKAERQIIASNKRFTKIFDMSPVAIFIANLEDGKLMYVNDAFCNILNYSRHDVIGKTSNQLNITDKETTNKIEDKIKSSVGRINDFEMKIQKSTLELIDVLCSFEIIEIDEHNCLISSFTDITERKITEKKVSILHQSLESKNKEVLDSIYYAKNIQNAFLPEPSELYDSFADSFMLCKPKDIVCGDFYWIKKQSNKILLAVADCTGHGVPGALMSMIGSQKLNDAVLSSTNPSYILRHLNGAIKTSLRQSDAIGSSRDGMDIGLCSINYIDETENIELTYAGANRPLFIIRKNEGVIEEIKGTKKAIGGLTDNDQNFTSHDVTLQKGDIIYLFSDGYADTFGGHDDKKLMIKKFKQLLVDIQHQSMIEQGKLLNEFIENWKGLIEQVDDILVIGIRL